MDNTVAKVKRFIERNSLLSNDGSPIIVGLSGGADSVALASVLSELGYTIICAHCNFHLRGEESDRDCRHAQTIAEMLSARFETIDFDTVTYSHQNSISIEEACRNLRYEWFSNLMQKWNAQAIAVGHNRNDNVETFLFNLQRGTGLRGLRGIQPINDRNVVRPLLALWRKEIEEYLIGCCIPFIVDSSNNTNDFSRNKLRNEVIPKYIESFPNAMNGISETIDHLSEAENIYQQFVEEKRHRYMETDGIVNIKELIANERMASLLIYEWFNADGLTRSQANAIINAASGSVFKAKRSKWLVDRGMLLPIIDSKSRKNPDTLLSIQEIAAEITSFDNNPNVVYFDASVLDGEPLIVRFWEIGDRIQPFGMTGSKKISDIFNDAKISCIDKHNIPLLCKGETILWVAGLRRSSHFTVDPDCRKIVRVEYKTPLQR